MLEMRVGPEASLQGPSLSGPEHLVSHPSEKMVDSGMLGRADDS